MGERKTVWRLVVDKWPTPDGKPFDEWGCTAHIERAPVGDWESVDA